MTARKLRRAWTEAEIRAYGVRIDGVLACGIAYDVGETKALALLRDGQVDFKVIKVPGRRTKYVVPVSDLLRLLGLDGAPAQVQAADLSSATTANGAGHGVNGHAMVTRERARR